MAFLAAGLSQRPSPAQAVAVLASARREAASCRARSESLREWLAGEVRSRGLRENAAVLAALEVADFRDEAAWAYVLNHPDRQLALGELLAALT
jgi:hypothetical protein